MRYGGTFSGGRRKRIPAAHFQRSSRGFHECPERVSVGEGGVIEFRSGSPELITSNHRCVGVFASSFLGCMRREEGSRFISLGRGWVLAVPRDRNESKRKKYASNAQTGGGEKLLGQF